MKIFSIRVTDDEYNCYRSIRSCCDDDITHRALWAKGLKEAQMEIYRRSNGDMSIAPWPTKNERNKGVINISESEK